MPEGVQLRRKILEEAKRGTIFSCSFLPGGCIKIDGLEGNLDFGLQHPGCCRGQSTCYAQSLRGSPKGQSACGAMARLSAFRTGRISSLLDESTSCFGIHSTIDTAFRMVECLPSSPQLRGSLAPFAYLDQRRLSCRRRVSFGAQNIV